MILVFIYFKKQNDYINEENTTAGGLDGAWNIVLNFS